jgi:hypothetical protein
LYYKNRSGNDRATYEKLDIMKNLDDVIINMEQEKKFRILLTSEELQKRSVPITPLKRSSINESDDDEDDMDEEEKEEEEGDDFELDAYKDWLMAESSETGNTYILSLVH